MRKILALLDFNVFIKNLWGQALYDEVKGCKSFPATGLRSVTNE